MSDNPIADAGLKLYPMAEVQDLRNTILRMNEQIEESTLALIRGKSTMAKARVEIEKLRKVIEELLDQTNCHSHHCKTKYWEDHAAGLNGLCICAVDNAKECIRKK